MGGLRPAAGGPKIGQPGTRSVHFAHAKSCPPGGSRRVIYRPPEREQRPRGRLNPTREIAVVLVLVALVLAGLLPVAFPNVPLPRLPGGTAVAVAPPTPLSMPQPYAATPPDGALTPGPANGATPALVATTDPFAGEVPMPTQPVLEPATPAPTEPLQQFPTQAPVVRPVFTFAPPPTMASGYPGSATATVATPSPSPTPGSPTPTVSPTATITGTPPTATPSATTGSATPTATATISLSAGGT